MKIQDKVTEKDKLAWLGKKEATSFIETFAECCTKDLDPQQRANLWSFYRFFLHFRPTKAFVFFNLVTIAENLGIPKPEFKLNGTRYPFWRPENEQRWKKHINQTLDTELSSRLLTRDTIETNLKIGVVRLQEAERRINELETMLSDIIEFNQLRTKP